MKHHRQNLNLVSSSRYVFNLIELKPADGGPSILRSLHAVRMKVQAAVFLLSGADGSSHV
jgi:hypothetical protein